MHEREKAHLAILSFPARFLANGTIGILADYVACRTPNYGHICPYVRPGRPALVVSGRIAGRKRLVPSLIRLRPIKGRIAHLIGPGGADGAARSGTGSPTG